MHDNIHSAADAPLAAIREAGRGQVGRQSLVETIALWVMPRETVRALSAEDRIRAWLEPE